MPYAHLRYFLGGDRPSQTTSHELSFLTKLVKLKIKSGISLMYKKNLILPLILHKKFNYTTQNYSKGARGLSV